MRATLPAALVAAVAVLGGCNVKLGLGTPDTKPDAVWSGYLAEIDGVPTLNSGIRLIIEKSRPSENLGPYSYTLATGCAGGGFVTSSDKVVAFEKLSPCTLEDVERMIQLNRLSFAGSSGTPDGDAALRWAGAEATLESPLGSARFRAAQGAAKVSK